MAPNLITNERKEEMRLKKSAGSKAVSCIAMSLIIGSCMSTSTLADTNLTLKRPEKTESTSKRSDSKESDSKESVPKNAEAEEPGKVLYEGHSYAVFDEAMSWDDAKAACEKKGGHLVCINDEKEQQFLQTIVINGKKSYYWIGLSDAKTEGVFEWVNGDPLTYKNWSEDQPDNWNNSEDSVMLPNRDMQYSDWENAFGTWNDMNSKGDKDHSLEQMGFLCEWDSVDEDLARTMDITLEKLEVEFRDQGVKVSIDRKNGTIKIDASVLFDVNSYTVKKDGQDVIEKMVSALENVLKVKAIKDCIGSINIQGHTDSDGPYEHNVKLSEKRAKSVRTACLDSASDDASSKKMLEELFTASGCACDQPVLDANGKEDKTASRRVMFVFYLK